MGQFLHFCIPIMPIMILCMFFIKLIVQIPFVQLLNPFIASIHSILLTLFYYCVPTFTERTLDDTLSLAVSVNATILFISASSSFTLSSGGLSMIIQ